MSTPDPGWAPDPQDPSRDRYWDGEKWTDQTRKRQGRGFMGAIRRLPTWVKIVVPIAVVLLVIGAIAGEEESDDSTSSEPATAAATQSKPEGGQSEGGETPKSEDNGSADKPKGEVFGGDPSENASPDNTPSVGPNGSVEVDTLRWRLDNAEATETIGDQQYGLGAEANGIFIVADLSVTNNKSESVTLTSEVVTLTAGDASYDADNDAESALIGDGSKTFFLEDIGPGVTATGKIAFDVAPRVLREDPQLRFNELGYGDTRGYITLPKLSG